MANDARLIRPAVLDGDGPNAAVLLIRRAGAFTRAGRDAET
jgi:hypothetical protein